MAVEGSKFADLIAGSEKFFHLFIQQIFLNAWHMAGTVLDACDTKRTKQSLHLHRTYISGGKTEKCICMYFTMPR